MKSAKRSAKPGCPVLRAPRALATAHEVVDEDLGMDALLDVEGRGVDDEVGPVLQVLAAPDELGVEVAVAALVGDLEGGQLLPLHEGLVLGAGQVFAAGVLVADCFDLLLSLCSRSRHLISLFAGLVQEILQCWQQLRNIGTDNVPD